MNTLKIDVEFIRDLPSRKWTPASLLCLLLKGNKTVRHCNTSMGPRPLLNERAGKKYIRICLMHLIEFCDGDTVPLLHSTIAKLLMDITMKFDQFAGSIVPYIENHSSWAWIYWVPENSMII